MGVIMDDSLKNYQIDMEKRRRIRTQALAVLRRSKEAGIPNSEMRIDEQKLKPYICPLYHKNKINDLCNYIYRQSDKLFENKFIVIDGGDLFIRRKAGFALLFRMIACDYGGKFFSCQDVAHKFQSIQATSGLSRNDFSEELKTYDVLFLEEFRKEQFKTGFEIQWFFDEILSSRDLKNKPTIFTFSNPVASQGFSEENALTSTLAYGQYMCMLSQLDMKPISNTLRIRVRT
jgi:hypothetical protein